MTDSREIRALAKRCEGVGDLPAHLQPIELQAIDRAIRDLGLVDETRAFMFYTRDLSATKKLIPAGHAWSLFSDGTAGCGPEEGEDMPIADVSAQTPELALCAAALIGHARLIEEETGG